MIKKWFQENLNGFLLSLLIPIGFILLVYLVPHWIISLSAVVIYLGILSYKVWKNKPF